MRYSVIIPVYNSEAYLDRCISSILAQKGSREWELILVDDGSSDSSGLMCDGYAGLYSDLVRVIHQENAGPGAARNAGVAAALGDYIYFMDSDDTIVADAFEIFDSSLEKFNADVFMFDFYCVWPDGRKERFNDSFLPAPNTAIYPQEQKDIILCMPSIWSKLFRRELFIKNDIRFPNMLISEDLATTPRLIAAADKAVYVDKPIYEYLQRDGSIMNSVNLDSDMRIMETLDFLKEQLTEEKVYQSYGDEVEFLAVYNLFIAASVRAIRSGRADAGEYVGKYRKYMKERFPKYIRNKYLKRLGMNKTIVFLLLQMKMYGAVSALFKVKG